MAIFENLEVEIKEVENNKVCEEYYDLHSDSKTTGRTVHHTISLAINQHFEIVVKALHNFDWQEANSLELRIDFDERNLIHNHQILISPQRKCVFPRIPARGPYSNDEFGQVLYMEPDISGASKHRAVISGLTCRRFDQCYQNVRFQTSPLADTGDSVRYTHQGSIWVSVERINVLGSQRNFHANISPGSGEKRASKDLLESDFIMSEITLDEGERPKYEFCRERGFKTSRQKGSSKLVGVFVFHYRLPEIYERIKEVDQAKREERKRNKLSRRSNDAEENEDDSTITVANTLASRAKGSSREQPTSIREVATGQNSDQFLDTNLSASDFLTNQFEDSPMDESQRLHLFDKTSSASEPDCYILEHGHGINNGGPQSYVQGDMKSDPELKFLMDITADIENKQQEIDHLRLEYQDLKEQYIAEQKQLEEKVEASRVEIANLKSENVKKQDELREQFKASGLVADDLKQLNQKLDSERVRQKAIFEEVQSRKRARLGTETDCLRRGS